MAPQGTIEVEIHSPTASIVTMHGEHDMASTAQVAIALAVAAGCPNILVDVSDSTFIDSSVIAALLQAAAQARKREGALELVVLEAGAVRRTLELVGVRSLLRIHEMRSAGIASVEASAQRTAPRAGRGDLRTVTAKIEDLQAKTDASRARLGAERAGVVVVRAQIADAKSSEDRPHPRAA